MTESLLQYYHEELNYLRQQGAYFAEAHPKVAGRLRLGTGQSEDPMVGRLLEGFAFITARLRNKIDQQMGNLTEALLRLLYPHYLAPIPALSMIQLTAHSQLDKPHTISANTKIVSQTLSGDNCFFTTCYPVTLWPIHVKQLQLRRDVPIKFNALHAQIKSCLSLTLETNKPEIQLKELKPDSLRFHINLSTPHNYLLYELLFKQVHSIVITHPESYDQGLTLSNSAIHPVGFDLDEGVLPNPAHSFIGYRLLSEYFAFPDKFLSFDLDGLSSLLEQGFTNQVQIHFLLQQSCPELESLIDQQSLLLHCTPLINLFEQTGEPINWDHKQFEYQVIPDAHCKKESIEVYRIENMTALGETKFECIPYFGRKYNSRADAKNLYWFAMQKPMWEIGAPHVPGTETFVNFTTDQHPLPNNCILSPTLLCINRDLPAQLPFGTDSPKLQFWHSNALVSKIRCLNGFTQAKYRSREKFNDIDLIAHIALAQITFTRSEDTLKTLKQVLSLYHYEDPHSQDMIAAGLCQIHINQCIERHFSGLKQGFCHGLELLLEIDEQYFPQHSAFLFGSVLSQFFAKSCSINSFTRFTLSSKQRGVIHTWKPVFGQHPSL